MFFADGMKSPAQSVFDVSKDCIDPFEISNCHEQHGEPVSIKRVRQLRNQILNESRATDPSRNNPLSRDMDPPGLIHASP